METPHQILNSCIVSTLFVARSMYKYNKSLQFRTWFLYMAIVVIDNVMIHKRQDNLKVNLKRGNTFHLSNIPRGQLKIRH